MLSNYHKEYPFHNLNECILYVPVGTGYTYRHDTRFSGFKQIVIDVPSE